MHIKSIRMINWKCFSDKTIEFNDRITFLRWANGTGKSSLIEAIIFSLFDKKPNGLNFDSLRNNKDEDCKIILSFEHNLSDYVIERTFGKSSSQKCYKDGELISRTKQDNQAIIKSILDENITMALWCTDSLAKSVVLDTKFLTDLMSQEFDKLAETKQYFQFERTNAQKQLKPLQDTLDNQTVSEKELKALEKEIKAIENKIKEKTYITDSQVIKAKQCEQDYKEYERLKEQLSTMSYVYDRDLCLRLNKIGNTQEKWDAYFTNIENELAREKQKASTVHPLAKYNKQFINSLITEGTRNNICPLCGNTHFIAPEIKYDVVDTNKIQSLEKQLEDKQYNLKDLSISIKYFQVKYQLEKLEYVNEIDWKNILENYSKETNNLYDELETKRNKYELIKQDLAKMTKILELQAQYNKAKDCINIIQEYVALSKQYYAQSICSLASKKLKNLNSRYEKVYIEDGIYMVEVNNENFSNTHQLAVQALSNGEKTMVALSLVLAIRDMFFMDMPLIMDEAFSNLDSDNLIAINNLLSAETSQWIIVSHDERLSVRSV